MKKRLKLIVSSLIMANILVDKGDMIELIVAMDDDQIKEARTTLREMAKRKNGYIESDMDIE